MNKVAEALSRRAVVGHRGFPKRAPENTLASFRSAVEAGVDIVEMDVQRSADGVVFVLHDDNLKRLAGAEVDVRRAPWALISQYKIGGEPIPTLEDALRMLDGRTGVFVEIKHPEDSEYVKDVIKSTGAMAWAAAISFYPEALRPLRDLVPLGLIYSRPPGAVEVARREGFNFVLPHYRLATERAAAFAHRLGLMVIAWTINDEDDMRTTWRRGVDAVASDDAELAVRVRRELFDGGEP